MRNNCSSHIHIDAKEREVADPRSRTFTVIVVERNEAPFIRRCLDSILSQTLKPMEIIVVDGRSTDGTLEMIRKEYTPRGVKVVIDEGRGLAAAKNLGLKHAQGEIVAFTYGDEEADPMWLKSMVRFYVGQSVAGVFGKILVKETSGILAKYAQYRLENWYKGLEDGDPSRYVSSTNCSYLRPILLAFGGFREDLVDNDDGELSYRISKEFKIVYSSSSIILHQQAEEARLRTFLRALMLNPFSHGQTTVIHGFQYRWVTYGYSFGWIGLVTTLLLTAFAPTIGLLLTAIGILSLLYFLLFQTFRNRRSIALLGVIMYPMILAVGGFNFLLGLVYQLLASRGHTRCSSWVRRLFDFIRLKWI